MRLALGVAFTAAVISDLRAAETSPAASSVAKAGPPECAPDLERVQVQRLTKIGSGRYAISYTGPHGNQSREVSKAEVLAEGLEAGKSLCLPKASTVKP